MKQFQGSELQQLLGRFAEPEHAPDKAEAGQLIKGFAQSMADQLEHFQLMLDATADSFGPCGLRERSTLAVSQAALVDLHAGFTTSPAAKRLSTVAAHTHTTEHSDRQAEG